MKIIKIFSLLTLTAVCLLAHQVRAEADYEACASLNDYLSYAKCVAEADSKNNGAPTVVPQDLKSQEGDYSVSINDQSEQADSRYVILNLTTATSTVGTSTVSALATKIAVAKDSNFGFSARQNFAEKVWWLLEDIPNETQYVYVKFFNEAGDGLSVLGVAIKYVPRATDKTKEAWASNSFLKLYKRKLDVKKPADSVFLEIAAYGLNKSAPKDEAKEKVALDKFKTVFKRMPAGDDWSLVHAMAYGQTLVDLATVKVAATTELTTTTTEITPKNCQAKQIFKTVMDVGSKGNEVKALQEFFQCLGLLEAKFKISGAFDKETENAAKKFQEKYELKCTTGTACGRIGPATMKKLNEVSQEAKTAVVTEATPTENVTAEITAKVNLKTNLTVGSKGQEVTALQKFLAQDKEIYPEGKITGTFGPATEAAVKRFQTKYELLCKDGTACGYVGVATRQKIAEVSGQ